MKLVNNNISPLPFYDGLEFQDHRKDYAFGRVWPLITYYNMLLPFQFVTDTGISSFSQVRMYQYKKPSEYLDITTSMRENGLVVTQYTDFNVWKYPGILPIVEIKHEGTYYIGILVNTGDWLYSDIFSVCNNVDDCLRLEYRNSYNFELTNGMVDFSDNFKFKCYLPTQVGRPEYDFEEETTDRMGYSFIESQVSKKIYKFTFLAPEYLCDALRIVRLCDTKTIYSKSNTYDLITFSMEPDWEDQGDLASVECEFETDTVIANIGGYVPELAGGDFNNDYDSDFYDQYSGAITLTISSASTGGVIGPLVISASETVKSDITLVIDYTNASGSEQSISLTIPSGEDSYYYQTGYSIASIDSAVITSQGSNDGTVYTINIVN